MGRFILYVAVRPEVGFASADQQKVLEYFFEFGLFDPVGFILLPYLQHILLILGNLYTIYSE